MPNAGKSTLINALVGEKVAIVSWRPQTTRNKILGVVNTDGAQVVLIDTPGIHQAKNKLVDEKLQLGQFDECPITMHDLNVIKTTIIETLPQVQHGRVSYEKKKA